MSVTPRRESGPSVIHGLVAHRALDPGGHPMLAPSVRFAPCPQFAASADESAVCECCGWSDTDHDEIVWLPVRSVGLERLAS